MLKTNQMKSHVAILRGINVGGHRKVLMADLRELFGELGYGNVETYIQSGNVVFDVGDNQSSKELEFQIAGAISKKYGFEVKVLVRTAEEWKTTVALNPFLDSVDLNQLHVTFLKDMPQSEMVAIAKSLDFEPDMFELVKRDVYINCVQKYNATKLSNNFFEKKLKVEATTRNWKTVIKIDELLKA